MRRIAPNCAPELRGGVPQPRVLGDVEAVHARLLHLLVRRAALHAVVEREVVRRLVDGAVEPRADVVDEERDHRRQARRAQLRQQRERGEHDDVAGDEARGEQAEHVLGLAGRRVQHLADPDRRLQQRVHHGEEEPERQRRREVVAADAGVADRLPLRRELAERRRVQRVRRRARAEREEDAEHGVEHVAAAVLRFWRCRLGNTRWQRRAVHGRPRVQGRERRVRRREEQQLDCHRRSRCAGGGKWATVENFS